MIMRYLKSALATFLIGALAACDTLTSTPTSTQTQQIETACTTAAAALQALTVVAPTAAFTASDKQVVSSAAAIVSPLCTASTPPTYSTAQVAALTLAVQQLTALQVKYAPTNGTQ
jgi:hypothetical protein